MTHSTIRHQRWRMTASLVAAAIVACSTAQAQETNTSTKASSGTLTIAWTWDPSTMDSQMHRQRYTQIISTNMRDRLYYASPPGLTLAPFLAESITQIDETHYDVKIREGVQFHNGEELTSADVVYTFERLWDPATESPRAKMGNMANVEGVEAMDRYTIRWTTKIPFGPADQAVVDFHLGGQEILNKAYYEKLTVEEAGTAPVMGAGPFKYAEWIPEQRMVMDAFEDYWQGTPGVERIIWRTVPEESTRVAELLAGSVDMIYPVEPDSVPQLKAAGMKIEIVPGTSMRMLMMNVRDGSPFADVEVRKAMNMAIDKESIVEFIYSGLANTNEQVVGINQQGYIEGYDPFPYDPEAAGAVLSKVSTPIEMFVQQQWELPAEAIAEQLRGYGMNVTVVVLDNASFNQTNEGGSFDLLVGGAGYGSGTFEGAYYNNHFQCSRLGTERIRTGFCNEDLDSKMAAAQAETDPVAKKAMLEEIIRLLSEDYVPWVPLFGQAEAWAMQPYVNGFTGSSQGQMYNMWKITLDK